MQSQDDYVPGQIIFEYLDRTNEPKDGEMRRYLEASVSFLKGKPRQALDSLAQNFDLVAACDALNMSNSVKDAHRLRSQLHSVSNILWAKLTDSNSTLQEDTELERRVQAEAAFWRIAHNKPDWQFSKGFRTVSKRWIDAIAFALERPDATPYIEAGIEDPVLIKTFLAEGIDVETALVVQWAVTNSSLGLVAA